MRILTKLSLKSVEWKEFKINDYFSITNSKPYHKEELSFVDNGIPYITRSSHNNGLEDTVDQYNEYILNNGNSISLGAENADFFYHKNSYITGNKMYVIKNINIFIIFFREKISFFNI